MKWLFIIFLVLNVCYFGWELDQQTRIEVSNAVRPFKVPANAQKLMLLKELKGTTDPIDTPSIDTEENVEELQLQNIISMMDQGNVMIEKKVIDELFIDLTKFADQRSQVDESTQAKMLCVSFGPFAEVQQANELSDWLISHAIQTQQRTAGDKKDQSFWIYLAPSESKDKAMAAIEDLKGKGVQDYKLINKGNLRNAISLGLFSTQSAVNRRLSELKNIGYKPVVVPYHNSETIIWVDAKVDAGVNAQENMLSEFINGYPSRFNSVPVKCEDLFR